MNRVCRQIVSWVSGVLIAAQMSSVPAAQGVDLKKMQENLIPLLQQYIQVDTTNPPGNEYRAVAFFSRIFDKEGIEYETAEAAPGRGNIWARIKGGDKPALILLHHSDVVPADKASWVTEPLSGEIKDGYIYGRGALDMKSTGILHLQAFLALHRSGRPLNRDVIFMATADEEAGGRMGAGWLVENRPDIFKNAGLLLTEGGSGRLYGKDQIFKIEITQKVPLWLRLEATGKPGHGSSPRVESAVNHLLEALTIIQKHEFSPRIISAVDAYFVGIAKHQKGYKRAAFENMEKAIKSPGFLKKFHLEDKSHHALTRNTCAITRLKGSSKVNVIPGRASAEIDCRLIPGEDPKAVVEMFRKLINNPSVTIETTLSFPPAISPLDTDLYRSITKAISKLYPGATIVPGVSTGFTDSHFFRDLNIASYGFVPMVIPIKEFSGFHGHNERLAVSSMAEGLTFLLDIVNDVVY